MHCLNSTRRARLTTVSLGIVATLGLAAAMDTLVEAQERPLTKQETKSIYKSKSWFWKDGVAYFAPSGRFLAYSGSGSKQGEVRGGWAAYRGGKVCFSGTWRTPDGDGFDSTCFLHKNKQRQIHQKREPVGDWYVFQNAPGQKGDEARKIVAGDYVSRKLTSQKKNTE
jgi:Protein of unknown function (DUF995)